MRKILTLIIAIAALSAYGQRSNIYAVDYGRLKAVPEAEYKSLLERFEVGDTTLTIPEIGTVYYGSVSRDFYSPERDYSEINSLRVQRRYGEMVPLCDEALKTDPVSLTLLFRKFAGAVNRAEGRDYETMELCRTKATQICDIIFASGTGVSELSPFFVVNGADIEQFLTNYLQVNRVNGYSAMGPLTVAEVVLPGREEPAYLYFYVYKPQND